jgi:hypothetical protein
MWSGWQWVAITRSSGWPPCAPANTCSQLARVSSVATPQSTALQPVCPSPRRQQPQVDVVERERQRHAQPAQAGRHLHGAGRGQGVAEG